jgi:microsomal dipeptidase-like Zn-dependent dipeptidase
MKRIIDIHCHPSFKPHNQIVYEDREYSVDEIIEAIKKAPRSIWENVPKDEDAEKGLNFLIKCQIDSFSRDSQSCLDKLKMGKLKSSFFSLHPFEMGWLRLKDEFTASLLYFLTRFNEDKNLQKIGRIISGVHPDKLMMMREKVKNDLPIDYYEELFREYMFVRESEKMPGPNGWKLKMVHNFEEYKEAIEEPKTEVGIFTIEGGHAFSYLPAARLISKRWEELTPKQQNRITKEYLKNVKRLKGKPAFPGDEKYFDQRHTPFYVTLVHMYYNFLSGHSKSFVKILDQVFGQRNGSKDGNKEITELGRQVIENLLHKGPDERRILIDVKHMSYDARKQYYDIVRRKRADGDSIPIVCSHGAVTGFSDKHYDGDDAQSDFTRYYLSALSINLFEEDIEEIVKSDGIIGIVTHEGRMPGKVAKKELKKLYKEYKKNRISRDEMARAYIRLIMHNLFFIVKTIDDMPGMDGRKAWDHICLGSDYDGIMDPFNLYPDASQFMTMFGDMKEFLENPEALDRMEETQLSVEEVKRLMYDLSPTEICEKIAYKNVENFLGKYFTDEYLYGKKPVDTHRTVEELTE